MPPDEAIEHVEFYAPNTLGLNEAADARMGIEESEGQDEEGGGVTAEQAVPDLFVRLEVAVAKFTEAYMWLADDRRPAPCRVTWRLYDHYFAHHLVPQMRALRKMGLSLAQVGTCALEGCNRPIKRWWRALPGGGQFLPRMRHNILVQILRRWFSRNLIGRRREWAKLEMKMD